jgi:hypothetical protein
MLLLPEIAAGSGVTVIRITLVVRLVPPPHKAVMLVRVTL